MQIFVRNQVLDQFQGITFWICFGKAKYLSILSQVREHCSVGMVSLEG